MKNIYFIIFLTSICWYYVVPWIARPHTNWWRRFVDTLVSSRPKPLFECIDGQNRIDPGFYGFGMVGPNKTRVFGLFVMMRHWSLTWLSARRWTKDSLITRYSRLMKVLIACEFSGIVRDAFIKRGHDATSCDLIESESAFGPHYMGDIKNIINDGWDLMIAHPPCTDLAVSGARWFKEKVADGRQQGALDFVQFLMDAPINKICIENPISIISSKIRKPDQIIQPWQFGHGETKATCLWLKNLPLLVPENIVEGREPKIHHMSPGPNRWKERSRTYPGIALGMANQWG